MMVYYYFEQISKRAYAILEADCNDKNSESDFENDSDDPVKNGFVVSSNPKDIEYENTDSNQSDEEMSDISDTFSNDSENFDNLPLYDDVSESEKIFMGFVDNLTPITSNHRDRSVSLDSNPTDNLTPITQITVTELYR